MDFPSRARIVLGVGAIVVALLASMALMNLLVLEPGASEQNGGQTGEPGNNQPFTPQPGGEQPAEGGEGTGEGEENTNKKNPCKTGRSVTKSAAITTSSMAILLWVLAVWWRQHRQTRVMNGWAIAALVVTLMAVTVFFSWYIVDKICSLRVTDLDSCKEIARNLLATFIAFMVPAIGFIAFAVVRYRAGDRFLGLWSGAGFVFFYLAIMAMGGWIIADGICDKFFELPDDIDPGEDEPGSGEPGDPGGEDPEPNPGTEPGNPDSGDPGGTPNPGNSGGQPGSNSGNQGNAGPRLVGVPQISPMALLVIMGIAAIVVIVVLAVRGGGAGAFGMGGAQETIIIEDRGQLLAMLGRADLTSRDKVVAGYRAFLSWCALRGVQKEAYETPQEHAMRAVLELDLPRDDTLGLAQAYSHTRLGETAPPRGLRDKALEFAQSFRRRP